MSVNVWGQVGVVTGFLPLSALTGTAGQLLGMNAAATLAEWKAVTFNTATNQLAVPNGLVGGPSYSFAGDVDTGRWHPGADQLEDVIAGVAAININANRVAVSKALQMTGKLFEEEMSADIVAAATTDLATATGNFARITNAAGVINIASFGGDTLPAGTCFELLFIITGGSVTLVYDANKIDISTGSNVPLQNGDIVRLRKTNDASPFYKLVGFQRGLSTTGIAAVGDLIAGTTSGGGVVPGIFSVGTTGQIIAADSSKVSGLVYIDNPSRPNWCINPNWQIDQINEGALYTVGAADVRGPDGISGTAVGGGVFKLRTVVDPDNAALKALEITCTTADAAIVAADDYFIYEAIEGYEAAALMLGTASALPIIWQFKFKSNVNGVYGLSIANSALNRRYIGSFTVADANEHEYTVTLTMDTAGAWLYTNGVGFYARICLAAGTNFQAVAGAWAAGAEQTVAAQANFMSNIANIAYYKRRQIIPGGLVQAYKPADIQKEFAKVQRHYAKTFPVGVAVAQNAGKTGAISVVIPGTGGSFGAEWLFPVLMRTAPNVISYNPLAANSLWRDVSTPVDRGLSLSTQGSARSQMIIGSGGAANTENCVHATADSRLA